MLKNFIKWSYYRAILFLIGVYNFIYGMNHRDSKKVFKTILLIFLGWLLWGVLIFQLDLGSTIVNYLICNLGILIDFPFWYKIFTILLFLILVVFFKRMGTIKNREEHDKLERRALGEKKRLAHRDSWEKRKENLTKK